MLFRVFFSFILVLFLGISSLTFATEIAWEDIGEYQQLFEQMEQQEDTTMHAEKRRCVSYDRGTYMAVSPACFLHDTLPKISFEDAVDAMMPWVEDVTAIYQSETDAFWYDGARLILSSDLVTLDDWSIAQDDSLLHQFAHHNVLIQVPKVLLAYEQIDDYAFFASTRDTSTYGPCRKKNYDIALQHLDGYLLASGKQLNMNKLIANDPDYCTGSGGKYLFYQGVCGGSTQLFWNALVNPYLYVIERYAHGEFRENFYGYMGEDAGIYENSKRLILENMGNESIYFKTFIGPDDNTVLISAYPLRENLWTYVQKQETGGLRAELVNKVTDANGGLKYEQERISNYRGINSTSDL